MEKETESCEPDLAQDVPRQKKRKRRLTEDRKKQNREAQRRFRERRKLPVRKDKSSQDDNSDPALQAPSALVATSTVDPSMLQFPVELDLVSFQAFPTFVTNDWQDATSDQYLAALAGQTRDFLAVPSPYMNYIQIQKLNLYSARMQNALHIGIPTKLAEVDETLSPWYWETQFNLLVMRAYPPEYCNVLATPPLMRQGELIPPRWHVQRPYRPTRCFDLNSNIHKDLAPTNLQRSTPHSLYIDIIPFPVFRDRIITLLDMSPPALDEDELKRDMEHDGLLIWGAARPGNSVSDRRNWECSKWFYKKWKILINGSGLEEQSRWWRRMRGEDESDDES